MDNIMYLKLCMRRSLECTVTLALSAPQVGILQRFFVVPQNFGYTKFERSPAVMRSMMRNVSVIINPTIL
jgi:peptide deformylase